MNITSSTLESAARQLYSEWTDEQGIHCNRFAAWSELDAATRKDWLDKAPFKPFLWDRADGVRGRYAVGRYNPGRGSGDYFEYWNEKLAQWGTADVPLTYADAIVLRNRLRKEQA